MFKEFTGSDRYFIGTNRLRFDQNIILLLDSSKPEEEIIKHHFIKKLNIKK